MKNLLKHIARLLIKDELQAHEEVLTSISTSLSLVCYRVSRGGIDDADLQIFSLPEVGIKKGPEDKLLQAYTNQFRTWLGINLRKFPEGSEQSNLIAGLALEHLNTVESGYQHLKEEADKDCTTPTSA